MSEQYAITGAGAREIAASVEAGVAAGRLAPGERLPSVRALAADLGVSASTVAAAVADLRRRGVVVSRPRSGLRVADRPPLTAPPVAVPTPAGVRDLATGNPDPAYLPDLRAAFSAVAALPPRLYGESAMVAPLRAAAEAALGEDGLTAAGLCAVGGALDGVERALAAHLAPGDAVAVEDPGYAGVLDLVRTLGLELVPVRLDDRGMVPEALRAALSSGVRAVILTPRGQNPTGAAFDATRARDLRAVLARRPDVLVVEDDHLGPIAGVPMRSLTPGRERWAAVRSISKWLGPDLRVAVLAGDPVTVARVEGRQSLGPGWVSGLLQHAVAHLWADDETRALAEQAVTVYAGRRARLLSALDSHGILARGATGLNVWVPVPDEDAVIAALLATGWAVGAGRRHRIEGAPAVRITISTLRPAEADRLAADLAAAMRPAGRTRAA